MKDGSIYSERMRKRFAQLQASTSEKRPVPELSDPLRQLATAILGTGKGDAAGRHALDLLLEAVVDWNEMRVSSPVELASVIRRSLPRALTHCERLRTALNDVFDKENGMSLDRIKSLKLREARQYLESIASVDRYAVASVVLWSLGGHAIPVDEALLDVLREDDLVHPDATRAEVQAFLERAIGAADAREFCLATEQMVGSRKKRAARSTRTADRRPKTSNPKGPGKHTQQRASPGKTQAARGR